MLQSIVQKSLNKVAELGGSSIAFPLIGSGNLGFPSRDASRIMLDEAVKFCLNDSQSLVRDIRFVLFHGDQRVIDAFKLESAALQARFYTTVEVVQDDLTKQTTDAIVNVIRSDMNMHSAGELGKAVALASGAQVEAECARLGHQPEGTAVITSGGNLAALNIIHMVVTGSASKKNIQQCVEKCLLLAESSGLKSISLPAAGTGAGGLSPGDSAQATFQAMNKILGSCVNLRVVRIVLFQAKLMKTFLKEHKLMQQQEETKRLVPSPLPVKIESEEPPAKKHRAARSSGPNPNKDKIQMYLAGPTKIAVKRATEKLRKGLADAFTFQKIAHKDVVKLSETQLINLKKSAKLLDVKLGTTWAGVILVQGEPSAVTEMVSEIWQRINEISRVSRDNEIVKSLGQSL